MQYLVTDNASNKLKACNVLKEIMADEENNDLSVFVTARHL